MGIVIISFLTGIALGIVFSLLKLPIPAPPNFAGVMGIVGVFVGFVLVNNLF
ncbi:XapX domain-containing protein [Oceanobacillus limi]|uniref:XapX domain-containing protein n=1 Tax=Oceanobacillus limi TaxID=930131 RepID=A0A1I0F938_9BACI|nr:XapX domain-containing protein [Oceanobacillus limi]SET54326.1 XapX domain-containing protein [Oceanobacillus limi]